MFLSQPLRANPAARSAATPPPTLTAVSPDQREHNGANQHTGASEDSDHGDPNPPAKEKRLRAILRAPEVVQDLYKADLMTQESAKKMGPKSPTPEQAANIAEARQELETLDRKQEPRAFRKQAREIVDRHLGASKPTNLDLLRKA